MVNNLKQEADYKIRTMYWVLGLGAILTAAKFVAWYLTHSNAILTDALESIINVVAAAFGLFSLIYSARPKDENHPYGHGKMEFLAVGFEGGLIFVAGGAVILKAIEALIHPQEITELSVGISITVSTGIINLLIGKFLIRKGKQLHSETLKADGHHLLADTYSSAGLLVGLILIYFTGLFWIDSVLAIILGLYIIVIGVKLLRSALAGLMDEADFIVADEIISVISKERKQRWIDMHNLRVVKYGSSLHIDAHLTLPWYDDLNSTHHEVKELEEIVNQHFKNRVEFFIHTDPCRALSCSICLLSDCNVRQHKFAKEIEWTTENLLKNEMHTS
ncbi:MAG: cation diffusion facilitator family transporter [Bacteroidetes bacterium]|nr:cation diffusion facilitator family transporter [Bacteroidota bacterium]